VLPIRIFVNTLFIMLATRKIRTVILFRIELLESTVIIINTALQLILVVFINLAIRNYGIIRINCRIVFLVFKILRRIQMSTVIS